MSDPKFDYADRLATDVRLLTEVAADVDHATEAECWETLEQGLICWALLADAARDVARIRDELAKKLADEMPEKRITVEQAGTFEQHRKADRKKWDRDELVRVVLDSQLVDLGTGEVTDPNPLDKILHVWNLGAPRVTALRERGINPDEFCEVEYGGLTLQLVADNTPKEEAA